MLKRGGQRGRQSLGDVEKLATMQEVGAILGDLQKRAEREALRRGNRAGPRCRDLALVRLLLTSGLRATEVCRLEARDLCGVKEGQPYLRIRGGKKRSARHVATIELRDDVAADLAHLVVGRGQHAPIFQRRAGRPFDRRHVWWLVRRTADRLGLRSCISPHSLRHSFITSLAAQPNADPFAVAKIARLRSVETVHTYFHLARGQMRRAIASINVDPPALRSEPPPRRRRT